MAIRKHTDFLPSYLRTEDLKKFFSSTVDQVFQPGKIEAYNGYIGKIPSYYDAKKDFYIVEPTDERAAYQLEPAMIGRTDSAVSRVLFYSDLFANLRSQGSIANEPSRMFDTDYYSWAPPIDIDKINNPQNYFWFGDDPSAQPLLELRAPFATILGNGDTDTFLMPDINPTWSGLQRPAVFVDNVAVDFTVSGSNVILAEVPAENAVVHVYRYGDIAVLINDQENFDASLLNTKGVTNLKNGMRVFFVDAITRQSDWDLTATGDFPYENYDITSYLVRGVGVSIFTEEMYETTLSPLYTVIARDSNIESPWSTYNRWVYKDAISWSGEILNSYAGKRPIIEILGDVELWNYGRRRVGSVDAVMSKKAVLGSGWDIPAWDDKETPAIIGDYDNISQIDAQSIDGQAIGTVLVDDNIILQYGMKLLIAYSVPNHPELSHVIMTVDKTVDNYSNDVFKLVPYISVEAGDMMTLSDGTDYVFNGEVWKKAQSFNATVPPKFALYDLDGTALDDPGAYPSSDFAGSSLFSYALGSGKNDSVLNFPLKYDQLGQIVFQNNLASDRYSYSSGEIEGFYFYKRLGDEDTFENDWHLVDYPSSQVPITGEVFTIPVNLESNPDNTPVTYITRSQWFDHFSSIMVNQEGFEGEPYSINNWQDTAKKLNVGTKILQHKSPLLKTMLLSSDKTFSLLKAINYVDTEYTRFRNRVAQKAYDFIIQGTMASTATVSQWLTAIFADLKISKTSDFPFALSTVGGSQNFIPPTPATMGMGKVVQPHIESDDTYGTPIDFLIGHDGSRIPLFAQHFVGVYSGNQTFVLNHIPLSTVSVTVDGVSVQYSVAGNTITLASAPSMGAVVRIEAADPRDQIMLGFEELIYSNIMAEFKSEASKDFELITFVDGKNRKTETSGYRFKELSQIISNSFIYWAQRNGMDYRTNATFDQSNPFTWNYGYSVDRDGEAMPGNWRAIYRYYYDTDRPHAAPWEMLGFSNKPTWWEDEYGPAPYTSDNDKLWGDLKDGRIRDGVRVGIDERYARANLLSVLPVDEDGVLLNPIAAGIIPMAPDFSDAMRDWKIGDHGPVENLWINSTSYPFALCKAGYLMKPARFVEFSWETEANGMAHGKQLYYIPTGDRPKLKEYLVHGELKSDGTVKSAAGIQQWIVEHMISVGQSASILGDAIRGLEVNLAHKVAGFCNAEELKVYADNFGLIPQEDVTVHLHVSPSIREEYYSGVVVEWTGKSWAVYGYNTLEPSFKVIPADYSGPKIEVSMNGSDLVIVDWRSNVYYKADMLVQYQNSVYRCLTTHTSNSIFEQNFWKAEPTIIVNNGGKILKYLDVVDTVEEVPYGTEFNTHQDFADFIFGYERYLESRGWVFDTQTDTGEILDWSAAFKQFYLWTELQWSEGNFIALSPATLGAKFYTDHGMIYSLEDSFSGNFGVVDSAGMPINHRDIFISRIDGEVTVSVANDDLSGVTINIGEIEHVLIFNNTTIFNDIIYDPLLSLRQDRLRLIAARASDWSGRLDAPGYVVLSGTIVPNFEGAAEQIRYMFDIEGVDSGKLRAHARHLIGYEKRDYLENFLLSDTQQFEFYQGMIHAKGAAGSLNKLLRSQYVGQERNLEFLEEWAFKVGTYGADESLRRISFELNHSDLRRSPQLIQLVERASIADSIVLTEEKFVDAPPVAQRAIPVRNTRGYRPGDLPNAGPVRTDEVDHMCFRTPDMIDLYKSQGDLPALDRIWIYEAEISLKWDVYQVCNASTDGQYNVVKNIQVSDDYAGARIYMNRDHGMTTADIGNYLIIDGETRTQTDLVGIQKIVDVSADYIEIEADANLGYRWIESNDDSEELQQYPTADDSENAPIVRVIRSVKFASLADATNAVDWMRPTDGELAYIDNGEYTEVRIWASGNWNTTYRTKPYPIDTSRLANALIYDQNTEITSKSLLAEPLVLDHMLVYDPISGFIPGISDRELSYKLEYDPAVYTQILGNEGTVWGAAQLGKLWWDLSAVRYLDAQTDFSQNTDLTRRTREIVYRAKTWGKIAPGTSVDVYEWVRSDVLPGDYTGEGEVYNSSSFVEVQEYNSSAGKIITNYYFWVKNRNNIMPENKFSRKMSASAVAKIIENPTGADIPWIAAISTNAFLISGVSKYLNDNGTVMQIDVKNLDTDNVVHTEWELLRKNDERSIPSESLWNKMIDSIAGMTDAGNQVPDMTLHPTIRQGLETRPRQSMFASVDANVRRSILASRESYVNMINQILSRTDLLSERLDFVDALSAVDECEEYLTWTSELNPYETANDASSIPEVDYIVKSLRERNRLLLDPAFRAKTRYVYINRKNDDLAQFSVWKYVPTLDTYGSDDAARATNADTLFTLAKSFDYEVDDLVELNASTWPEGARIKVSGNAETDDFWSIWKVVNGVLQVVRAQRYRMVDFWDYVDWYDDGYSKDNSPVITYATESERNLAENPYPRSNFVKIEDDGQGKWIWTVYENDAWRTVAREKATIELSSKFYDSNTVVYGGVIGNKPSYDMSSVKNRDGSYELRILSSILKAIGLTALEINELFFSMVHFAHAHLDQVQWAFKTSFLYIAGYDEQLIQTPVNTIDGTDNLISYLEEVKPYRVKIREFARTLTPTLEKVNARNTDFDKPLYYDTNSGAYRRLSDTSPSDLSVISTTLPWKDWYESKNKTGYDLASYNGATWNPIRRFTIKLTFDRIDGPFNLLNAAAKRINDYYNPTSTMPEKNLIDLLKLSYKGSIYSGQVLDNPLPVEIALDGNTTSNASVINPNPTVNAPLYASGRPEEMVISDQQDFLYLNVQSNGRPGAPKQTIRFHNVSEQTSNTVTLHYLDMAQTSDGVAVFADGRRLLPSQYTIDNFKREVTVSMTNPWTSSKINRFLLQSFGTGGTTKVIEQSYFEYNSGAQEFSVQNTGEVEVVVNGERSSGTISGKTVTVNSALSANDQVMINIREPAGDASMTAVLVYNEVLEYDIPKTWELTYPSTPSEPDEHVATIVELNGLRLTPPPTYYGSIIANKRYVQLGFIPLDASKVKIVLNDFLLSDVPVFATNSSMTVEQVIAGGPYASNWVILNDKLVCVTDSVQSENVRVFILENHDYEVSNGTLVVKNMAPGQKLMVTTFRNASLMQIKTVVLYGRGDGIYEIPTTRTLPNPYYWVTVNGVRQVPGVNYVVQDDNSLRFRATHTNSDVIVVTVYQGEIAEIGRGFAAGSVMDLKTIMRPVSDGDWDVNVFDFSDWDTGQAFAQTESPIGPRTINHMDGGWEFFADSAYNRGVLTEDVYADSTDIKVRVEAAGSSSNLFTRNGFRKPQPDSPGVIWINGERIEYGKLAKSGSIYTLSGLKRGTRNTRIGSANKLVQIFEGDGSNREFTLLNAPNTANILVNWYSDNGIPVALDSSDYTLTQVGSDVLVTLPFDLDTNEFISVTQSSYITTHKADEKVLAASVTYSPDRYSGNVVTTESDPWILII